KGFVLGSILVLIVGLMLTNAVKGNTLSFLSNAAPLLGILTVFYQFRSKLSGTSELEAACPYSPAQLAAARVLVVLSYDILLCLAASPLVSYWQGRMLGEVFLNWLAPLLMMLGISLAVSLHLGISSGCLVAAVIWFIQLTISTTNLRVLLGITGLPLFSVDLARLGMGMVLLVYSYLRWNTLTGFAAGSSADHE
ncbi:MAG TPA: hypothetical protein VEC37_14840, partial [Bacillota bacterium]|nr:hypothetical protein [Bacillota bacterium]